MQEKYEEAIASLAEMEKRVVMAESMLEATLQYQSGQDKVLPSPRYIPMLTCSNFVALLSTTVVCPGDRGVLHCNCFFGCQRTIPAYVRCSNK